MLEGTRYIIAAFLYLEKEDGDYESLLHSQFFSARENCIEDGDMSSPARKRLAVQTADHSVRSISLLPDNKFHVSSLFSFNFDQEEQPSDELPQCQFK